MDLQSLHIASALVSPFPTWEVEAGDERALMTALAQGGTPPQTDIFEPWEPDAPWGARVLFPDLEGMKALVMAGSLRSGESPGMLEWLDRGRISVDTLESGGVEAHCYGDLEQGGLLLPDFIPADGPWMAELTAPIQEALGGAAHRVSGVVHRSTGRFGVLVEVTVRDAEPLLERQAVMDAMAHVMAAGTTPRLVPTMRWWFDMKRVFVLAWAIAPCGPGLEGDRFVAHGVDLSNEPGRIEVHARLDPHDHDGAAVRWGEALGPFGFAGCRPRWTESDGKATFLACWEGDFSPDLVPMLAQLSGESRLVPGCPPGLEADWVGLDPVWKPAGQRLVVRWHCGLQDRDLLPVCTPREGDATDAALALLLGGLGEIDPVWAGRAALRLRMPAVVDSAWQTIVALVGALDPADLHPVVHARRAGQTTLLLYRSDLQARAVPQWHA